MVCRVNMWPLRVPLGWVVANWFYIEGWETAPHYVSRNGGFCVNHERDVDDLIFGDDYHKHSTK